MVYSFEGGRLPKDMDGEGSALRLSRRHRKDGESSLCWQVEGGARARLAFHGEIGYHSFVPGGMDQNLDHFVAWVYLEAPLEGKLRISFFKKECWCCGFSFGLGFRGWRTCWVPFRDMEGRPLEGMDRLEFQLDGARPCNIYFDQVVTAVAIDPRHAVRDWQVPFVNLEADGWANAHWTSLYRFSQLFLEGIGKAGGGGSEVGQREVEQREVELVEARYEEYLASHSPWSFPGGSLALLEGQYKECCQRFARYQIREEEGAILGVTVDAACQKAAYPPTCRKKLSNLAASIDIKEASQLLLDTAYAWHVASQAQKQVLGSHFGQLFRHLLDQGWAWGSGMGTTHHLGYPMRHYYCALFLMRDWLSQAGLKQEAAQAMAWFSGSGRMFRDREEMEKGESMDTLNTLLQGILASVLMMEDPGKKHGCLRAMCRWLSASLAPAPGLAGPFKEDGSVFHHCGHYPAYAMGGLAGAAPVVWCLSGTSCRLGEAAHKAMKKSLLAMGFYCNKYHWPISMSARHPKGQGQMSQISSLEPFYYMALAGTPDGREPVDRQMAGAFLRLADGADDGAMSPGIRAMAHSLRTQGFEPEGDPQGHWSMNYACAAIHRRDSWMAAVRGHSRYLWGSEIYEKNNLYGRYITYGHLEILDRANQASHRSGGYFQEGWDWNCFPGITAPLLSWRELKAKVGVVDPRAGMEEMLLSDQAFAGGVVMDGWQGAFAMKLHGHGKYDGSFRALKSWFFFDNRILCLGREIEDKLEGRRVRTTLYQDYMGEEKGQDLTAKPCLKARIQKEGMWLEDLFGNWYYLAGGQKVEITRTLQTSRAQDTGKPTCAPFEKAWIDHGAMPHGGWYEYLVLVQPGEEPVAAGQAFYQVLQADGRLHQVLDLKTGIMAYVFFQPGQGAKEGGGHVAAAQSPCLVMERTPGQRLVLSICDPDLRLYEGVEEDQVNGDGSQREVSLYSRKWREGKSQGKEVCLQLKGRWRLAAGQEGVRVETGQERTLVCAFCIGGRTVQVELDP